MKPDMSPQAVGRRLRKVGELVRLCRALRIKSGSAQPVEGASDNAPPIAKPDPLANQAGDQVEDRSSEPQQQSG